MWARRFSFTRRVRLTLAVIALGVVVAAAYLFRGAQTHPGQWSAAEFAAAERTELELAQAGGYYLVLSGSAATLSLRAKGVEVQGFHLLAATLAVGKGATWRGTAWTEGRLDPKRTLVAEQSRDSEPGREPIPPLPEEAFPAPETWSLRFRDGREVILESVAAEESVSKPGRARLRGNSVRVLLQLSRTESDRLYRALPDGTPFLILP